MALDPQDPAILALLVQRIEQLTSKVDAYNDMAININTLATKMDGLESDNSDHHRAIKSVSEFAAQTKGGTRVLYTVILLFSGFMTGATLTAIGLFFHQNETVAGLAATVKSNRNDLDILLGARK